MKKTGYNIIQFSLSKELQHGMMVSILAGELARKAGLSEKQCHELSIAGLLHDIGKLEMAKYVYQKGQKPLTIEEIKYVRLHPIGTRKHINAENCCIFTVNTTFRTI